MAARNRCSSTLPESSTWVVQEPPLRFCASWAASSRDSTPPAIKRSTIDLLTAAFILIPLVAAVGARPQRSPNDRRECQDSAPLERRHNAPHKNTTRLAGR